MFRPRAFRLWTLAFPLAIVAGLAAAPADQPHGLFEALPDALQDKVTLRDHPPAVSPTMVPFYIVTRLKKWLPGQTLRVAFLGGTPALHQRIAAVANTWTQYANIHFDFGYDAAAGTYRTLGPGVDAEIRISFNQPGYWSLVGTDSIDANVVAPDAASMNFTRFDVLPPADEEFRRVVLHEFGHALGLEHEHQSPAGGCDAEFDWPKVTAYLMGPPNNWSQQQVDFNLRQLPNSSAYDTSMPDRSSIMFYHFEAWMFVHGASSPCCVPDNTVLSDLDKQGIAMEYPFNSGPMMSRWKTEIARVLANPQLLSPAAKKALDTKLRVLQAVDK